MRMSRNVNDWERFASIAAGAMLVAVAVRKPRLRRMASTAGTGLIARGVSGYCPVNAVTGRRRLRDDPRRALAGPRGMHLHDTVHIARPPDEIYRFWRHLGNLPAFLQHIERVDVLDACRSHWVMRGPAGMRVEWDAEIVNEIESEHIGWRSLAGADVANAGSVHFRPAPDGGTFVEVKLQYAPPAGKVGASLAWLTGSAPSSMLHDDLVRLKGLLEGAEASRRAPFVSPALRRSVSIVEAND